MSIVTGTVISLTRRYALIDHGEGTPVQILLMAKWNTVSIGDRVAIDYSEREPAIHRLVERKNQLLRSYFGRTKIIASNLDMIFILTAPAPLTNTLFIDRVLIAACSESIPCILIVNKIDLGVDGDLSNLIEVYSNAVGIPVQTISVKDGSGIGELKEYIQNSGFGFIALSGLSGVGKSSLMNILIPEAERRTSETSLKTGQGTQTTTHSHAFRFPLEDGKHMYILDSPGLQNFGLSHLQRNDIKACFSDFTSYSRQCGYRDCMHLEEPGCKVKEALQKGFIAEFRYNSYLHILSEIEHERKY